jgi:peptidoglycan/LPS O-acetylase OafA/YrhL
MFKHNNIFLGLLYGSIAPAIAWFIFEYILHNDAYILNKPGVPYLLAIGINLILVRFCVKNDLDKTARGLMFVTFAAMILMFILRINLGR